MMPWNVLTRRGRVQVAGFLVAGEWLDLVYSGRCGRGAAGWIQAQELAQVEDQGGEI